jgi:hypothetical protein
MTQYRVTQDGKQIGSFLNLSPAMDLLRATPGSVLHLRDGRTWRHEAVVEADAQAARQERLPEADGPDSDDRRATSCSHYGEHVPEDFTGCARCLLAQECYDEYVKRAPGGCVEMQYQAHIDL